MDESIVIKLINTCPIDNYLTIFFLYLESHPGVLNTLTASSPNASYAKCQSEVVSFFTTEEYGSGKVQWLRQFPKFDFTSTGTVDVWGCEQDMILPCFSSILSNSVWSFCNSPHCPQGEKDVRHSSMLIVKDGLERREGQSYLEAMTTQNLKLAMQNSTRIHHLAFRRGEPICLPLMAT